MKKKENGITVIALIITVIIIIIISGVAISTITSENGLISKANLASEETKYNAAKEKLQTKIAEIRISKNGSMKLVDLNEIGIETSENYDSEITLENTILESNESAKLKIDGYIFTVNNSFNIINVEKENNNTESNTIIGDEDLIPINKIGTVEIGQFDPTANLFDYSKGARITYVTNKYTGSGYSINGGYTGENTAVGNATDSFWLAHNTWNIQGALENDNSIDNIKYNHYNLSKASSSATCLAGNNTVKQTIIIDPRAYYGDSQSYTYEIDDIYLASAVSDGDAGQFNIYISTGGANATIDPNDSSWQYVSSGNITENGKVIKACSQNLKFRYLKLEIYARNASYMELSSIKAFKKFSSDDGVKISATRDGNSVLVTSMQETVGIDRIEIEDPQGLKTTKTVNLFRIVSNLYPINLNGLYKIKAIDKNGNISTELQLSVQDLTEKSLFEYSGNLFNYSKGSRVTYVTNKYNCSGYLINGGYTGENTAVSNITDSFWQAHNSWNVQGCLENDDSKISMNNTHTGATKSGGSSTCLGGNNTVKQSIIITPRALQGDTLNYLFKASEIYLGSANSDGDVGRFEIYVSCSDNDITTNPNDISWALLTTGEITKDWELTKVYTGNVKFRFLKIITYARVKSYMEFSAIKIF